MRLNNGTAVVDDTDVIIMPGERVMIGRLGLRQEHAGARHRRLVAVGRRLNRGEKDAKMFLLPQRPYVPIGTLRRAATYPDAPVSAAV